MKTALRKISNPLWIFILKIFFLIDFIGITSGIRKRILSELLMIFPNIKIQHIPHICKIIVKTKMMIFEIIKRLSIFSSATDHLLRLRQFSEKQFLQISMLQLLLLHQYWISPFHLYPHQRLLLHTLQQDKYPNH